MENIKEEKIKISALKLRAEQKLKRPKILTAAFLGLMLILFLGIKTADASTLFLSPASGSYNIGDAFSVNIFVSSAEQAMNAASGVISFPADKLEVSSLSKSGSIFSLWVQEPAFSNASGVINFEGIVLNPGFSSSNGKIVTINFKAKAGGSASVAFSSGSVLANDGQGTNILTGSGGAKFTINSPDAAPAEFSPAPKEPAVQKESAVPKEPAVQKEAEEMSSAANAPAAPKVSSPTHPNQGRWYKDNNPKFEISLPKGITGVNVLADRNPDTNPGTRSDGLFSSYTYEDVDDGVWYFHIRLRNAYGWGDITHWRFQIDTQPPEPVNIQFIESKEIIQPRMKIVFNTVDALSGIDYYQIKIRDVESFNLPSVDVLQHNPYTLPPQKPGVHKIKITAFDKAGNYLTAEDEFTVRPEIAPKITEYPRKLEGDEILKIKGETIYLNAQVAIWLQGDGDELKSYVTESNAEGIFIFSGQEKLADGTYNLWATVIDEQKNQSKSSEKVTITVGQSLFSKVKSWTMKTGAWAIELLAVVIPIIAMVALLAFLVWYGWTKFSKLKIKAKKEIREAEEVLRKALHKSKKNIKDQIEVLEKIRERRKLVEEEEKKIIERLKNDLKYAEGFTKKEIKNIKEGIEEELQ